VCKECGKEFWTEYGNKHREFCSDECSRKYANRNGKIKRRMRMHGNGEMDGSITLVKLYKRDKGICYICGKKTDLKDYYYDEQGNFIAGENYPTIDHVIPL